MFIALFSAFHAPAVGVIVAGVLLLPVIVCAWLGDWSRHRRVAAYLRERQKKRDQGPGTRREGPGTRDRGPG